MRKINDDPKNIEDLMFADIAESIKKNVLWMTKWLYLVTWPTWSWKSTSMVSMINHLNEIRNENIITIEDPIEFIFTPKKSLINQREVWHDTRSFSNALRASMREDPDIIFVWEIRDKETAEAALNLSETWHLVFSTLHTSSASMTVNRYISFFPPEIQDSIADRLADTLVWVQSQILVKNTEWSTRVWIFELMLNNTAVKNNIKKRELAQIDNIIETSSNQWMISLKQYAKRLIELWIISTESVSRIFNQQSQD
jgi:twitching motility protein PilT